MTEIRESIRTFSADLEAPYLAAHWVQARDQDGQDRRQVRLVLTSKGEALRSIFPPMEVAAMNEFTACLTTEELMRLGVSVGEDIEC
ncbi:hypothetical protein [Pseudomonas sp. RT6P73]